MIYLYLWGKPPMKRNNILISLVLILFLIAISIYPILINNNLKKLKNNIDTIEKLSILQRDSINVLKDTISILTRNIDTIIFERERLNILLLRNKYSNMNYDTVGMEINGVTIPFWKGKFFYNCSGKIKPISSTHRNNYPATMYYGTDSSLIFNNPPSSSDSGVVYTMWDKYHHDYPISFTYELNKTTGIYAAMNDFNNDTILIVVNNNWFAMINNKYQIKSTDNSIIINDKNGNPLANLIFIDDRTIYFEGLLVAMGGNSFLYLRDNQAWTDELKDSTQTVFEKYSLSNIVKK